MAARAFIEAKHRSLTARARRLARLGPRAVGIRPQDVPFAPSRRHFAAARARLADIDRAVAAELAALDVVRSSGAPAEAVLAQMALVERQIDRSRRAFDLFFDVFSQRGTAFAPALYACDCVARDCYRVVRARAPRLLHPDLLPPITYLEHDISPATYRRGVVLQRLLGESNPFPLVRVPYEHVESPWGMGVFLHEVGHNLQADLGVWTENQRAVARRLAAAQAHPIVVAVWTRWHKEIFADLVALLLGGPTAARAMAELLAHPPTRALAFNPTGVHPVAYLRGFVLAEMLTRMGFHADARALGDTWRLLYRAHRPGRTPTVLLAGARPIIEHVVDEVAFQPRRGLGLRALADVVRFTADDQRLVEALARELTAGHVPPWAPARLVVSASRLVFESGASSPRTLARAVIHGLAARAHPPTQQQRAA